MTPSRHCEARETGRGRLVLKFFFLSPLLLFVGPVFAADPEPVTVRGDQVEFFDSLKKVIAVGKVEALYRDVKLTCDHAVIYMETKDAYLKGRVRLMQIGGLLKGEEILYNFGTRKGTILRAEGEAGEWRTKGDRAEKISADSFIQRDGTFTSCDFEDPHTRLRAREVQVFLDDRVVLKDVLLYLGSLPMFYLPSYTHLLDDKRPRVTLVPGKDKEWGLFLLTSWRVYLHENLQGRFHADYRERLDLATGLDLKYRLPVGGEGIFREYYTLQRAIQREHFYSSYFGSDKGQPTTELERHRFQLRHIWNVDEATKATLEYNRASDAKVVEDFFEREFEENTASPDSYFQVIRQAPWYGLTFVARKQVNRYETVTEQLPFLSLDLRPLDLSWLPTFNRWLYPNAPPSLSRSSGWFYQSSYSFERSNVADANQGTENSLSTWGTLQELFYPMRLFRWLNLRPFFRFRETVFSRGLTNLSTRFRQAGSTGFEMSGKFFRVFPLETDRWGLDIKRLRHVVTPTLSYEYQGTPTISAKDLLRSDGLAKRNLLTPGIEQKLQTKRSAGGGEPTVDLGRFQTQMPYDIEGASGAGGEWQNVTLDAELLPYRWLRVESDATLDSHIGKFATINVDLTAHPSLSYSGWAGRTISEVVNAQTGEMVELPWAVGAGWRYQRNTSSQLTWEAELNLGRKWRAGFYQVFDVKRFATETGNFGSRTVKKVYNLGSYEYRLQRDLHEWTGELVYNVQRGKGNAILLLFRLKAAPDLPFEFERSYHRPKAGRNFPKAGSSKAGI